MVTVLDMTPSPTGEPTVVAFAADLCADHSRQRRERGTSAGHLNGNLGNSTLRRGCATRSLHAGPRHRDLPTRRPDRARHQLDRYRQQPGDENRPARSTAPQATPNLLPGVLTFDGTNLWIGSTGCQVDSANPQDTSNSHGCLSLYFPAASVGQDEPRALCFEQRIKLYPAYRPD